MNDKMNPRVDRRHRGSHSTACKCPAPFYQRPSQHKSLSGEHGRVMRNLMWKDKTTGRVMLRRRVSTDPLFVFLREACGRRRAFRPERAALLDMLYVLMIDKVDLATFIVTLNVSALSGALSPRDSGGKIIPERRVTASRVSRLLFMLARFGIIELPQTEWDRTEGCRFPKHVILTETAWRLGGASMDKLRAEQQLRIEATADGILEPGEDVSVKTLRKRWYETCRHRTILCRRTRAMEGRQRRQLKKLPFDERKQQVAEQLFRSLRGSRHTLTPRQFEKMVWQQLYQLELVNLDPPGTPQPH